MDVARVGFEVTSIVSLNDIKFVMPDRVREKLDPKNVSCMKVHTFDGYHRMHVHMPRLLLSVQGILRLCCLHAPWFLPIWQPRKMSVRLMPESFGMSTSRACDANIDMARRQLVRLTKYIKRMKAYEKVEVDLMADE